MPISTTLPTDTPLLIKARALATMAHAGQRYGSLPYIVHPIQVEQTVRRFGIPPEAEPSAEELLAAALTHDVLEDTPVTRERLELHVSEGVARIVWAVTDKLDHSHPRLARHQATYPYIPETPGAVRVKLSDRIANLEAAIAWGQGKLVAMYLKEYGYFKECLYKANGPEDTLWEHLETLIGQIRAVESLAASKGVELLH